MQSEDRNDRDRDSIKDLIQLLLARELRHLREEEHNPILCRIEQRLENTEMKITEIKAAIATAAAESTEAFTELAGRIGTLQTQIDELIAAAVDPDVTDETFLADLNTVKTNVAQLAAIVPNVPPVTP